jgi:hypothetical protein
MRGIKLRFLLLFAVLCAGLHAPALAHDAHDNHDDTIVVMADGHHAHSDDAAPQDNSSNGLHELYHHHHCPMAMAADDADDTAGIPVARSTLRPREAAALLSRATAPPTQPPLA